MADGPVALGGDGHHHEDGRGHAHVADGVQEVREQVIVPGIINNNINIMFCFVIRSIYAFKRKPQ